MPHYFLCACIWAFQYDSAAVCCMNPDHNIAGDLSRNLGAVGTTPLISRKRLIRLVYCDSILEKAERRLRWYYGGGGDGGVL